MVGSLARRWTARGLLLAGMLLVVPLGSASAASKVFHSPPQLTIGPLAAGHGFKVTIFTGCDQAPDFANLMVARRGRDYALSYDYVPHTTTATTCNVAKTMGAGSLRISWGSAVQAKLKFVAAGAGKPLRVKGCSGSFGHTRKVQGTGTLKLAIHTKVFGKLLLHAVPAQIQVSGGRGHCPPTGSGSNFVNLTSTWPPHGSRQLDAYMAPNGHRSLYVSVQNQVGKLYQDVANEFHGSRSLFSFASDLRSAHIGSPGPLLSGSLSYSATGQCTTGSTSSANAFTFGKFTGRLVVHDPVLGPLTFRGADAQQPALSRGPNSCAASAGPNAGPSD